MPADAGPPPISPDDPSHWPFVQTDYANGQLTTSILDCPFARFGEPCSISRHGHRIRKTGPVHALTILHCHVHGHSFTVYPFGFVPYARRQLVDGPVQHGVPSLLDVIGDTATNGPRDRTATGDANGSWSTQLRLIDLVSRMFGLGAIHNSSRVANAFGVPLTDLVTADRARGCRARAGAIKALAAGLTQDDLLALGALSNCWGQPYRWAPRRDQLLRLPLSRGPPTTSGQGADRGDG